MRPPSPLRHGDAIQTRSMCSQSRVNDGSAPYSALRRHNMKRFAARCVCGLALAVLLGRSAAQNAPDYDHLVRLGNSELQTGNNAQALAAASSAITANSGRWEAYAIAGGALLNMKRYEEAADQFSHAIDHAPEPKKAGLRDLRKQCLLAESGVSPTPPPSSQGAPTTQAELVLWKTIEHSSNVTDFQVYLQQYPNGTFSPLARQHLTDLEAAQSLSRQETLRNAVTVISVEHDHDAGVGNLFTAGATIGQCYGDLEIGRKMITYKTSSNHGFSVSCSRIDDLELKSKYGKNNMIHMVVDGKKMNFFSHNDPHSAADIIGVIHSTCGSAPEAAVPSVLNESVPAISTTTVDKSVPGKIPSSMVGTAGATTAAQDVGHDIIVHIFRNQPGGWDKFSIRIDGVDRFLIENKHSYRLLIPPGKHVISAGDQGFFSPISKDIDIAPGHEYWFRVSYSSRGLSNHAKIEIEPLSSDQATKETRTAQEVAIGALIAEHP